jgi:septum formation protein
MLLNAGLTFDAVSPRVDEESVRDSLLAEGATGRDVADTLAEIKARRVALARTHSVVIGSDQVLLHRDDILSKPSDIDAAKAQLRRLRGSPHKLLSAVVVYERGEPVWRHAEEATLTMRVFSDDFLEAYVGRMGPSILDSVGAYRIEDQGIRLFDRIDGDHFVVLGMPLLPLLSYLAQRGFIEG